MDVAAQVFEFVALIDTAAHFGMQAKALLVDTALLRGLRLLARDGVAAEFRPLFVAELTTCGDFGECFKVRLARRTGCEEKLYLCLTTH